MDRTARLALMVMLALAAVAPAGAAPDAGIVTDHAPCVATTEPVRLAGPYACGVRNGDFEDCSFCSRGSGQFPEHWHRSGPSREGVAWTEEASHFLGRGAMRFDDVAARATSITSSIPVPVDGGGTYVVSAWHKGVPDRFADDTVVEVLVFFYGLSDWPVGFGRTSAVVGDDWTQLTLVAPAPDIATKAHVVVRATWEGSGSFLVDDVALATAVR